MRVRDFLALAMIVVLALGSEIFSDEENPGFSPPSGPPFASRSGGARQTPSPEIAHGSQPGRGNRRQDRNIYRHRLFDPRIGGSGSRPRHVTEDCDTVALKIGSGRLVRVQKVDSQPPHADISILWTRGGTAALPVIRPQLRVGQDGYSFGFPQGAPGDLYGRIVGRRNMLSRGPLQD